MTTPIPGQEPDVPIPGIQSYGPCAWQITPDVCGTGWDDYPDAVKDQAIAFATVIMWAATGRRYNLCPQVVRPFGRYEASGWRWAWGGLWGSYGFSGIIWADWIYGPGYGGGFWGCTPNAPLYQIPLPGPVAQVTQVLLDGDVVDPATYRVDDNQWLVRHGKDPDGNLWTWPCWQDFNEDTTAENTMEVSYLKGSPPPQVALYAAGVLAAEYAKGCTGAACRLPGRMSALTRQGASFTNVDPDTLLDKGFTGVFEVDQVINALNPYGIKARARILSPDMPNRVRTVTQP